MKLYIPLMNAILELISKAFLQTRTEHPRSSQKLCVRFDETKLAATSTCWAVSSPNTGVWVESTAERFIRLSQLFCDLRGSSLETDCWYSHGFVV